MISGTNNAFHISTKTSYAIRYNDKSVLENHHVSSAFIVAQKPETNIFANFIREDYTKIRERIIALVLSTDMSFHFADLSKIKGRLATSGLSKLKYHIKPKIYNFINRFRHA